MTCHQHAIMKTQIWEGDPVTLSAEVTNGQKVKLASSQVAAIEYSVFRFLNNAGPVRVAGPTPLVVADVWIDGVDPEGWNFRTELPSSLFVTAGEDWELPIYRVEVRGTGIGGDRFWIHAVDLAVNPMFSL